MILCINNSNRPHRTEAALVVTCVLLLAPLTLGAPQQLMIATYNVQNMFDVFDDPYTSDERTAVKPRVQIQQIANAIRSLKADVVTFSELETEGLLRAMVHEMLSDMGYQDIAVMPTNSERGIHLGIISKVPIVSLTSHRFSRLTLKDEGRTWRFARDLLRVRLQATPKRTLDVYIVHFKSKRDEPDDPQSRRWRLAEATMVRRIIDRQMKADPHVWLLLVGDINDTPDSSVLGKLLAPDAGGQWSLADMHNDFAPEQRITYLRAPYRSTVDYILASPALVKRFVPGSARVFSDPDLLSGSDHAPVAASFDVSEVGQ